MVRNLLEMALRTTSVLHILHHFHLTFILQGTTRNMAAPPLAGLIMEFFYTGPSALGSLFPEVFAHEVPKPVDCLTATAVSLFYLFNIFSQDVL